MSDWPNYLIRQDFTARGNALASIPTGVLDENGQRLLAAILTEVGVQEDKDKWNLDPASLEYSLVGAEVVYNGPNKYILPTFSFFKNALGLKFPAHSVAPTGAIYLCWYDATDDLPGHVTPEPPLDEPVETPPEPEDSEGVEE